MPHAEGMTNEELNNKLRNILSQAKVIKSLINKNSYSHNTSYLKQLVTDMFFLGSDAALLAGVAFPVLFWGADLLESKSCTWIKKNFHFNVGWIWDPVFKVFNSIVICTVDLRLFYWTYCLSHYMQRDTNFNETMRKMASNSLVPYDMTEFYRILIYGNDDRFAFVKMTVIDLGIDDLYRDRQIRNGMTPQF